MLFGVAVAVAVVAVSNVGDPGFGDGHGLSKDTHNDPGGDDHPNGLGQTQQQVPERTPDQRDQDDAASGERVGHSTENGRTDELSKTVDRGNKTDLRGSGTKLTDEGSDQGNDKTDGQHVEAEHGEKFLKERHCGARGSVVDLVFT